MRWIILECNTDETLVTSCGFSKKEINHAGNIGAVLNYMEKKSPCIGIADKDPGKTTPKNIEKYKEIEKIGNVTLKQASSNNQIIVINPDIEEWIVKRAKANSINLIKDYKLPDNANKLHDIDPRNHPKYKALIEKLVFIDKEGQTICKWLQSFSKKART